jgi:hypothetical protein
MNNQQNISYTVVEELFNMIDVELRKRWSKRRQNAERNIQLRETQPAAQKTLRGLKPELRNR